MTTKKRARPGNATAARRRVVKALVKALNAPAAKKKPATKAAARWCLGVFTSAAHEGQRIVAYRAQYSGFRRRFTSRVTEPAPARPRAPRRSVV